MKTKIILAISALALTSGLQALTTDEQVAANTIDIGLNNASIEAVENTLAAFEDRINILEAKVTTLESFHLSTRVFTITGSDIYYFGSTGFSDKIKSLNFNDGEWLYISITGDMLGDGSIYTREMCTSDSRLTSYLNKYSDPTLDPMASTWFHTSPENELTYIKHNMESIPNGLDWNVATSIWGEVLDFERLKLGAVKTNAAYVNVDVLTSTYGGIHNGNNSNNTATYRAGTTRYQACGF